MKTRQWARLAAGLVLTLAATGATAQDVNYWSIQYGPVGQLLGGQVIASTRDLTATFYNPGGMALEEGSTFLLSTESVQAEQFSTRSNSDLKVLDTSTTRFGSAPTLVAGALPRSWLGERTRLAWSFLTRQQLKARLGQRYVDTIPSPALSSSTELFLEQDVTENWAGLTASRALSETLGVGLTWYGVYRGQTSRNEVNLQAVTTSQAGLAILGVQDFSYSHFRTLAKLGVAWEKGNLKLGLNVTTPSLGLFGSGEAGYTLSLVGTDPDGDGVPAPPVLAAENAKNLNAEYKSSWAVGGGFAWDRGRTQWHASVEWFAPVSRFDVLTLPSDDPTLQAELTQELKSVVNFGLGVEHGFENGVVLYGAGFTDKGAATGNPQANVSVSNWNLYHLSSGVKFRFAGSRFTLGATYSFGGKERLFPLPVDPGDLPGGSDQALDIRYRRIVLLLGFLFGDAK
jgi:hypothetical protein